MYTRLTYKSKQFLWLVLKVFIVIACTVFIVQKIQEIPKNEFQFLLSNLSNKSYAWVSFGMILLMLSIINWAIEIKKWQSLVNTIQPVTFFQALQQSLASLTASLITPNRLGEYPIKALYFSKMHRARILTLNALGNGYQFLVTLIFGVFGIFGIKAWQSLSFTTLPTPSRMLLLAICLSLLILGYFARFYVMAIFKKIRFYIAELSQKTHQLILLFAFLRYLIFSHQCYYMLISMGATISYSDAMLSIFSMYLLASIIPFLSAFDVLLKGSIAVILFSLFEVPPLLVLSTMSLMWIFNFMMPASIGMYFLLTFTPKQHS